MLTEVVNLISSSTIALGDDALFCTNLTVDSRIQSCITYMQDEAIIENSDFTNLIGQTIKLDLSLNKLAAVGYFLNADALIRKHRYESPKIPVYIEKLGYNDQAAPFFEDYQATINLVGAIKDFAKHTYTDNEFDYAILFREDRGLILPFDYAATPFATFSKSDRAGLKQIIAIYDGPNSPEKLLYINELIDYLLPFRETDRFKLLLQQMAEFSAKALAAYQYYLRDFSLNKLRLELDSKALEYTQKIQSVINDSQTKLIAIPTAFILVFSAFDFKNLNDTKNWVAIASLVIFAILIQIFIANQYSSLTFTAANVENYKSTFTKENIAEFDKRFSIVQNELKNQRGRLRAITILLWLIPMSLIVIWVWLSASH